MFQGVQFTSDCQEHTRHTLRQSLGSTLDGTEKEKPCSGNKQDNKKESSPRVEKSPSVLTLHMEKENHNSDGDKPVEVIPKVKVVKLPKQPLFGIKFRKESSCATQSCVNMLEYSVSSARCWYYANTSGKFIVIISSLLRAKEAHRLTLHY